MKNVSQFTCEGFEPVYNIESKVLILGSYPSVVSREQGFYYGNKNNRFWKVIGNVFNEDVYFLSTEENKKFLLSKKIALFDVIKSCNITGSSDASIRNVVPNDIDFVIKNSDIQKIFLNGKTAYNLFIKYFGSYADIAVCLPSTSSANAIKSLDNLVSEYSTLKKYLD